MNTQIKKYNNLVYESGPIRFDDYMNDNPNKIHSKLYIYALKQFILAYCVTQFIYTKDNANISILREFEDECPIPTKYVQLYNQDLIVYNTYIDDNNMQQIIRTPDYNYYNDNDIPLQKLLSSSNYDDYFKECCINFKKNTFLSEIYPTEYWKPSSLNVIFNSYNHDNNFTYYDRNKNERKKLISKVITMTYSLENWWNHTEDKNIYSPSDVKVEKETLTNPKVKYLNYIKGKAIVNDQTIPDYEYNINFDMINENTNISDEYSLLNTFKSKLLI